ncbi:hypothetical protein GGP85_003010 [Salinibacter ruber]|uniref:hypothetical protein n=1 Tax=Salinibacter ruber TaxID=146919 RepID=UPI002166F60D|nr:hypothetical protein [Salinibacter ruber]MCS3827540.1 hypothetical protein [Salinibacter ruber]
MSDSALQCLLALIHLSFRFDPAEGKWTCTEDWLSRSDIEAASGLSDQGTRNGLSELESIGWARADRSGRSYHYQLALGVPTARFTQVPTALLDKLSTFDAGAGLRVVLAVLRGTWGWTSKEMDPQSGTLQAVHDRWTELPSRALAKMTGRSKTAVTRAAQALQGEWLGRVRPGNGPYQYRFLPEAIGDDPSEEPTSRSSSFGGGANDLPPDRQNSDPPPFNRESSSRDKHRRDPGTPEPDRREASPSGRRDAVRDNKPPRGSPQTKTTANADDSGKASPPADFSELPPEKRQLAKKLANVGVWAGRIAEILSRFSRRRIQANFDLYRERAAEQIIRKPGAWLYEAITEGYALEPSGEEGTGSAKQPVPGHKETLSEAKKEACVAQGIPEERFHRCLSPSSSSSEPQFMYFAPEEGGPERRV